MALPNTDPIYSKASDLQANTALIQAVATTPFDAAGTIATDIFKVFQADATNGGFVQRCRIKYIGSTTSVACLMRFFISSATSGAVTAANAWLYDEILLPASGAPGSTTALTGYDMPFNFALPLGYTILVKISAAQTAAMGWQITTIAGKY